MILKVFWIKHCFEKAFTKHSLDGHIARVYHLNVMKSRVDDSSGLLILRSLLKYCGRLLTARHHNHTQVSAKHFRLNILLFSDCKGFALTWLKYSRSEESVVSSSRDRPKSATLQTMFSSTNIFRAARSWKREYWVV